MGNRTGVVWRRGEQEINGKQDGCSLEKRGTGNKWGTEQVTRADQSFNELI